MFEKLSFDFNFKMSSNKSTDMNYPRTRISSEPRKQVLLFKKLGYRMGRTIGKGTFSKVCLATDRDGAQLACRIIDKKLAGQEYVEKFLPREIDIVTSVKHPNIVSVHRILETGDAFYMVMEHCPNGDLLEYIRANGPFGEHEAKPLFRQLSAAVAYLHGRGVAHRDLKCENVLLDGRRRPRLADFGFARRLHASDAPCRTFCGSAAYAAPEVLKGEPYDARACDAWALGCVLYVTVAAEMPFDDGDVRTMLRAQMVGAPLRPAAVAPRRWSRTLCCLLGGLLETDIGARLRVEDVLQHEWLTTIPPASFYEGGGSPLPPVALPARSHSVSTLLGRGKTIFDFLQREIKSRSHI